MKTFPHLSDEQLADEIVTWAGRLAAGEAEQSALLADFDRREAWAGPGLLSCAHWLAWRTGLSPGAARERVRVARALGDLPHVEQAYSAGRLSFSQVRAVTRVANSADEHTWVDVARHATGGQLERLVRGVRRARRYEQDAADPEAAAYRMRATTTYAQDGSLVLTIRMSTADAPFVQAALEQVHAELDRDRRGPRQCSCGTGCRDRVRVGDRRFRGDVCDRRRECCPEPGKRPSERGGPCHPG